MDQNSYLSLENVKTLSQSGLLGLVVPKEYGGLGGGLTGLGRGLLRHRHGLPLHRLGVFLSPHFRLARQSFPEGFGRRPV